ncbi:DUF4920 domain-containing protein [Ningiella sp. W23]|uniref:DUF4920 domain-containing protein n=1 Tax=Ningiella sp. W23 TaxID=3023715 RepID=UPI003756A211
MKVNHSNKLFSELSGNGSAIRLFSAIALYLLVVLSSTAGDQSIRLSEPIAVDATSETFGAPFDQTLPTLTVDTLFMSPEKHLDAAFSANLPITKVCQKKGCFFIAQHENKTMRVSFKDYGFFIPTDAGGKTVSVNGELVEKNITPAQAAHFTEDLDSESAHIAAGKTYEIVASSVIIPLS